MNIQRIKDLKTFEDRYNFDISAYVETKVIEGTRNDGGDYRYESNYISWAYAEKMAEIVDPDFDWYPIMNEVTNSLVHDGMVLIEMKFLKKTRRHYYPILDGRNKAVPKPTAFDINTAQMRGMTKLFSMMSGFGLSLYTNEDLNWLFQNTPKSDDFNREKLIEEWTEKKKSDKLFNRYITSKLKELDKKEIKWLKNEEMKEILKDLEENPLKSYEDMTEDEKYSCCLKTILDNEKKHKATINKMLNGKEYHDLSLQELEAIINVIKTKNNKGKGGTK